MGQFLFLLILSMATVSFGVEYKLEYAFDHINFEWESQKQMEDAIRSGDYNISRCFLYDVDQANDGTIYVTIPKELGPGVPATVATITDQTGSGGPLLSPFPDWNWHNGIDIEDCYNIINVYSIKIVCNHIFIMDTGKIGTNKTCDPKLLVFDLLKINLNSNPLVDYVVFPSEIASNKTGAGSLVSPVVYIPGQSVSGCSRFNERIVFIADREGSGLVVYNRAKKHTCRIESKYMKPTHNNFTIGGQSFIYEAGINSMTIIGDELYFIALSGLAVYKAKISELVKCPNKSNADKIIKFVGKLSSQAGAIASTKDAIVLNNLQEASILGVSPLKTPFDSKSMVVLGQDSEELLDINAMKVLPHNKMLSLSGTSFRFFTGTVNLNKTNFYIFSMDLIKIKKEMYPIKKN